MPASSWPTPLMPVLAHADVHGGVNAVVLAADGGIEEVHLQCVGAVDQDDDELEGAVVLQCLQILQQLDLFSRQLQIVAAALGTGNPAVVGAVGAAGQVCTSPPERENTTMAASPYSAKLLSALDSALHGASLTAYWVFASSVSEMEAGVTRL